MGYRPGKRWRADAPRRAAARCALCRYPERGLGLSFCGQCQQLVCRRHGTWDGEANMLRCNACRRREGGSPDRFWSGRS